MCKKLPCPDCGKPTAIGCGQHLAALFKGVPEERICACPGSLTGRAKLAAQTPKAPQNASG